MRSRAIPTSRKMKMPRSLAGMNALARRMVKRVHKEQMSSHRGILPMGGGLYVLFGNDRYSTDARSKAEAQAVHEAAKSAGCLVSAIAADKSGQTWAVSVIATKRVAESLLKVVWDTWFKEPKAAAPKQETEGDTNAAGTMSRTHETAEFKWRFPSHVSADSDERTLAEWMSEERRHYKAGRSTDEQIRKLESLPNWSWDDKEAA